MMTPDRQPEKPEFGAPDPALFAPLTDDENEVLHAHLRSGWYKQAAVGPKLSGIWRETSELLTDLHTAWETAFAASQAARTGRPAPARTTAGGAS